MSLIQKISAPHTFWGRVPAAVYGVLWSLLWLVVVMGVMSLIDGPLSLPAGAAVAVVSLLVSLWVTKA